MLVPGQWDWRERAVAESVTVRKRQPRGERRIAQLLDAARQVFAECGYSATSTNAIAARAGVSPGTLYQYFPNREAIAEALCERYAPQVDELQKDLALLDPAVTALPELVARILAPLLRFHRNNPAWTALCMGPDTPRSTADLHVPAGISIQPRVQSLIAALVPGLPPEELRCSAQVTVNMFRSVLPLVMAASDEERPALQAEIEHLFLGYASALVSRGRLRSD
jgi:AcrR family transcriptional regulator